MFGRITFVPTLAYNLFMERVSSRSWFNRIDEHVLLGALPWKSIAPELIGAENVKAVVSMNEDYELFYAVADRCFWTERDVRYLQLSTPDIFNAPSLEQLIRGVHFMQETADRGGSVYVHCKAGRTRSATLVACYLIQKYKMTPTDAVRMMEERRPHVFLRRTQHDAIDNFYDHLTATPAAADS